ncbi:MAG: TauD/TfdA family dioxygenase [Rhodovibrionaceae bacterium]|nr:TauD/TfdA family dioxygenase [Rhodovibrionaceae bacterium]
MAARTQSEAANTAVQRSPAEWRGPEMAARDDWIVRFTDAEAAEIEAAVEAGRHVDLVALDRQRFPLPSLGARLAEIAADVVEGRGFVLLRGLPVERWDRETSARAFYGIGCYFGVPVPQNRMGHLLGHVKDLGLDPADPDNRIYQTSARHLFHTDSADMVGLLCLQKARRGGLSAIASSTAIFREIEARRPDLAEVLCGPFHVDRKGEIPEGKGPTYELAIYHRHGGRITCIYARDFIEAAQRHAHVPPLTPEQVEAMDLLDDLANSDEFQLRMAFEPGDIQFLHNHQILHARTAYEDWPEPERRRHLLRLWLSTPNGRPLPEAFAERYGTVAPGRLRGGIRVPGQRLIAPLDA